MENLSNPDSATESVTFRLNQLEDFEGKRDSITFNTDNYKMEQYLALIQICSSSLVLAEENKIMFVSTYLSGASAVWWFTLVRNQAVLVIQVSSVAKYLFEFRNAVLTIPDITEGEKFDKFVEGLKCVVRFVVMKSTVTTFEEAAQVSLRVDSAIWSAGSTQHPFGGTKKTSAPMEISNLE
eukprot:IDg12621t1